MFHTHNYLKSVLCDKSKNASVRCFMCMSSMCVQLFTVFKEEVLTLDYICTLVRTLKSKMAAISMEMKRGKKIVFLPIFHTDHNKCTMKLVG